METFFQGKLDNFCAIYAVLNALKLLHDLPVFKARDILNTTLMDLSQDRSAFQAALAHKTDYLYLVDHMLNRLPAEFPLKVARPFPQGYPGKEKPCVDEVWQAIENFMLEGPKRTGLIRFCRFMPFQPKPCVDHWSTIKRVDKKSILLFDASLELDATHVLPLGALESQPQAQSKEFFYIPPYCLRLVCLPQ